MFKTFPMGVKSKSGVYASLFLLYVQTFLGGGETFCGGASWIYSLSTTIRPPQ